jgi:Fe-S-cluster containining protein
MSDTTDICISECGSACCRTPQMRVQLTHEEADRLAEIGRIIGVPAAFHILGIPSGNPQVPDQVFMEMGPKGRCVFLDHASGKCRVYRDRPGACRRFPHHPVKGCLLNPGTEGQGVEGNGVPRR